MAGPIPGITELDAQAVEELYKRLLEGAKNFKRFGPRSISSFRPVGGLPPASITAPGVGLATRIPSAITGPVLGTVGGLAISQTEAAADELNKSLDEYSPTEITNTPEAIAAYFGLPYARGVRYKGPATPEPVKTKPAPTTAPQAAAAPSVGSAPGAGFVGPEQWGSQLTGIAQALDYTKEGLRASLADGVTGQPSAQTEDADSGGNGITAVKDPATGKVTFVTRNRLGGEGGYDIDSEIGYRAGLNALAGRELGPRESALPNEGQAVLAEMKRTSRPMSPQAPTVVDPVTGEVKLDVTQIENWNDFMDASEGDRLTRRLGRAQLEQSTRAAEVDPREIAAAELRERQARAHLLGSQGEAEQAGADFTRARTAILQDPVAQAMREGRASAEQTLAFRARLVEQAVSEIDPAKVERLASAAVLARKAPDMAAGRKKAMEDLVEAGVHKIIAGDPELQRAFIQQTGTLGGYSTGATE